MIHYTCDMCGKPLHPDEDIRYVVKIEAYAARESEEEEEDFEELTDYNPSEEEEKEVEEEMEYRTLRFDLCAKCHEMYIQDPLFLKGHRSRFLNN